MPSRNLHLREDGNLFVAKKAFTPHSRGNLGESGLGMVELLVVLFLIGILLSTAMSSLGALNNPLRNGAQQTMGFFKQVRSRAISTTKAYVVSAASPIRIQTHSGTSCSTASTAETNLFIDLPLGASFSNASWSTCFDPRGLANANIVVTVRDDKSGETRDVEVFLGGAVRESRS